MITWSSPSITINIGRFSDADDNSLGNTSLYFEILWKKILHNTLTWGTPKSITDGEDLFTYMSFPQLFATNDEINLLQNTSQQK